MAETEFFGGDLRVRWAENPENVGEDLYQIEFDCANKRVIKQVKASDVQETVDGIRRYATTMSWAENLASGLTRSVDVTIKVRGADGRFAEPSEWVVRTAYNPAPPKPTLTYAATVNAALVTFAQSVPTQDFRGWVVHTSTDPNYVPEAPGSIPVEADYQGNSYPLTLTPGQQQFMWVAAYDLFGKSDLNFSDRIEILPFDKTTLIDREVTDEMVDERVDEFMNTDLAAFALAIQNQTTGAIAGVKTDMAVVDDRVSVEVTNRTTQLAALGNAVAIIESELETDISELEARTSDVEWQASVFEDNLASANSTLETVSTKVDAEVGRTDVLFATTLPNIQSSITNEATVRANADTALGTLITNLTTTVGNNRSLFDNQVTLQATNHTAQGTLITNLSSRVGSAEGAISSLQSVTTNGTFASATSLSNLSATVGGHTSSISDLKGVTADHTGKLSATWGLSLATGNVISGIRLSSNGSTSEFKVSSDAFNVVNPAGSAALTWENGRIWNKGSSQSFITGQNFGTTGDMLLYAGPNPSSVSAANPSSAAFYLKNNGDAGFSGVINSSLMSSSAISLGSCRIHCGGDRTAPFTIFDFTYKGRASGAENMTHTLTGFIGPSNGSGYSHKRFARQRMDVFLGSGLIARIAL